MMNQEAPQKIFIWNEQGYYKDCAFPDPIYGHFLGGQEVKGRNVYDVLETPSAAQLLEAIQQTRKSGSPKQVNLALFGGHSPYHTLVRLFPFSEHIMGWINDYPLTETLEAPLLVRPTTPSGSPKHYDTLITYSPREREVCGLICEGKSNTEIAHRLQISERTVRFHLENLFRKFQVSSRLQLAHRVSSLVTPQ